MKHRTLNPTVCGSAPSVLRRGLRSVALAAALAAGVTTLAACGSSASSTGEASITVGLGGNIFDTPVRLAQLNGYFSQQGLKVSYVTLTASTEVTTLQSGSVQFIVTSPNDLLAAVSEKLPVQAVSAIGSGNPLGLVVSKKFAKQHGLTAATPAAQVAKALAKSTPGYSSPNTKAEAGIFLKAYGVNPDGLSWVSLPSAAADQAALKNNQVDWFITSEPVPLELQNSGDGVVVADPLTVPQWSAKESGYSLFVVAKKSYGAANASTVRKFVTAVQQATSYMSAHPGDAKVLSAAEQTLPNVPAAVLKSSLAQVEWAQSGQMTSTDWNTTVAFLSSLGTATGGARISASDWTNQYLK